VIFLRSLCPLQLALRSLSEGGPVPILSSLMRFALYCSFVRSAVMGLIWKLTKSYLLNSHSSE
jgi:hypothetical protein